MTKNLLSIGESEGHGTEQNEAIVEVDDTKIMRLDHVKIGMMMIGVMNTLSHRLL